jgi:tryptophan synthase alpha chain
MPYLMGGFPDLDASRAVGLACADAGADLVELGVPFSDPLADGPVIQRAGVRALAAGASLARVLELLATLRADGVRLPIVLMTYYNPVLAFGLKSFARTAADAGADGVIVPDLPLEESEPLRAETEPAGLDFVQMVAPTSTPPRLRAIARVSRGFIYVVSVTGITGERRALPPDLDAQMRALRLVTTKPLCVGFGVASPEHVAAVGRVADGVIVGSAIVRLVERHTGDPRLVDELGNFIAALKSPLKVKA